MQVLTAKKNKKKEDKQTIRPTYGVTSSLLELLVAAKNKCRLCSNTVLGATGGWVEKWGLKLISTQVVVEVEVGVELGNNFKTAGF